MRDDEFTIRDLNDLRDYIYETICEQNDFEVGAFELTERILIRAGQPCGIFFCLHGPRSIQLTAIWENDGNTIWFYGSTGERIQKTQLKSSVEMSLAAA